jgi:hypothetical protein
MRKRLKNKRRSRALCKPHKRGHATRWTPRAEDALRRFEHERRAWEGHQEGRAPHRDEQTRGTA